MALRPGDVEKQAVKQGGWRGNDGHNMVICSKLIIQHSPNGIMQAWHPGSSTCGLQSIGDEKIQALYTRPYIYLTQAEMDAFLDETSRHLFRIYQQVWVQALPTGERLSALDLDPD